MESKENGHFPVAERKIHELLLFFMGQISTSIKAEIVKLSQRNTFLYYPPGADSPGYLEKDELKIDYLPTMSC
jgi:hypothetical protein